MPRLQVEHEKVRTQAKKNRTAIGNLEREIASPEFKALPEKKQAAVRDRLAKARTQLKAQEGRLADIAEALTPERMPKRESEGMTLMQALRKKGGVTPEMARDMGIDAKDSKTVNKKGLADENQIEFALDDLDMLRPGEKYADVVQRLERELKGEGERTETDLEREANAREREGLEAEARKYGIDPRDMTRQQVLDALEREQAKGLSQADMDEANSAAEFARQEAMDGRTIDDLLDEVGVTDKDIEDAKYRREAEAESQAAPNEAERARTGGDEAAPVPEHSRPAEQARADEVRSEPEPGNEPPGGGSGKGDGADGGQEPAGGTPSRDYPGRAAAHRLNALPLDAAWDGLKAVLRGLVADDSTSGPLRTAIADAVRDAFKGNWREKVARTLGTLVWSDASVIKSVAEARNSPTLNKVWRMFSDMGGTEKVHGETFEQQVTSRYNRNVNEVAKLLEGLSPDQVKQVKALLENRRAISGSAGGAHQAARRIAAMLDAERKWLKDAGVDIGDTKDYFPRVYLAAEIQRRAADFKAAAERAYRMMGVENPKEAAEAWYHAITLKGDGVPEVPFTDLAGGAPAKDFAKTREIPADVARKAGLDAFTDPDVMTVLDSYFRRTAKRGAFEERFGGQKRERIDGKERVTVNAKWNEMREALIDEGNADLVGWAEDRILAMSGQMRTNVSQGWRDAMSLARAVTVATFLRRAVISSLTEPLQIGNRTAAQGIGAVAANTLRMYAHGAERLARTLTNAGKGASEAERYRVAQLLGTILNEKLDAGVAAMKFDGDTMPNERGTAASRLADRLSQGAMKASGLHDWTNANVADSTTIGIDFLKAMAEDTTKGRRLAHYELDRLGIPEADHADFAKYVAQGKSIDEIMADMRAGNKQAQQFVGGVDKFVRQVIMKPTAADKPHLAKHPVAQMMYGLQSWMYSYWYNVQKANLNQIREAVKGEGYTPKDRATMAAAPALYTAAVLAMTGGMLTAMRDLVAGRDKDKEREEKQKKAAIGGVPVELLRTMSQAQMFGLADPFVNSLTSARYNKLPGSELGGPAFGRVQRYMLDRFALVSDKNSPTTNMQERRAAESFYNLVVDPALAVTAAAAPLPLGHALTFASQRDEIRRAVVDGVAGPAKKRQ